MEGKAVMQQLGMNIGKASFRLETR